MATCASCKRPIGNLAKRCLYCGAAVDGAASPAAKAKPVACVCPGCARTVRVMAGEPAACMYCALTFTASSEPGGPPRLGPAHGGVSRAHVAALTSALPPTRTWQTVGEILRARADRDELTPGEAETVLRRLGAVLDHPADGNAPWLPLELEEAEQLVPRALFGQTDFGVSPETGCTVLTIVVSSRSPFVVDGTRLAANAIGLALEAGIGVGFSMKKTDHVEGTTRFQLRVELVTKGGGVALAFANQVDDGEPTALSAPQRDEVGRRIVTARTRLVSYYLLAALYGPGCRFATAFNLMRDAIGARMTALACPATAQLLDALCLRMPTAYGS